MAPPSTPNRFVFASPDMPFCASGLHENHQMEKFHRGDLAISVMEEIEALILDFLLVKAPWGMRQNIYDISPGLVPILKEWNLPPEVFR